MTKLKYFFAICLVVLSTRAYFYYFYVERFCVSDTKICVLVSGSWQRVSLFDSSSDMTLIENNFLNYAYTNTMEFKFLNQSQKEFSADLSNNKIFGTFAFGRVTTASDSSIIFKNIGDTQAFNTTVYFSDKNVLIDCENLSCLKLIKRIE
jgi:hypothetical protein